MRPTLLTRSITFARQTLLRGLLAIGYAAWVAIALFGATPASL
jgi:hypothetical protein